jgi:hypothetical protein
MNFHTMNFHTYILTHAGLAAFVAGLTIVNPATAFSQVLPFAIDNGTAHEIRVDFCSNTYQNRCWPSAVIGANRSEQFSLPNCVMGEQICYRAVSPDGSVIAQDCSICGGSRPLPAFVRDGSTASLPHDPIAVSRALQNFDEQFYGH